LRDVISLRLGSKPHLYNRQLGYFTNPKSGLIERVDKLRAMKTFVAIAEHGTLTAAAKAEHTSLPAVVRMLGALEDDLGIRLFHRTTRRVSLTEEGRRYRESCRTILALVSDAENELDADHAEPRGNIVVTAPVIFGQRHVAPGILRFLKRYPDVRVDLRLLDRVVNLVEEGIDLGVRIGHLHDSSLVARPVGSMRRLLVATRTYLRKNGRPKVPYELLQHNCIRFWNAGAPTWSFSDDGRTITVPVSGRFSVNHSLAGVEAVASGLGIGLFPAYQVANLVRSGTLEVLLPRFEVEPRPIHLVVPEVRFLPRRIRLFMDAMKTHLEGEAEAWAV
jgi:DNA-binding transcriptional LysR family regulator